MKVLVVGASRGTGAAVVAELARRGHLVTAFARSAGRDGQGHEEVRYVAGDVLDPDELRKAMVGQDAVAVTLGIPDNPFRVRLTRRASSPLDIRSRGTRAVIDAMIEHGVPRLVVQSTYGIGETYAQLPISLKLFFTLAIRPQVKDQERQEQLVRESSLAWTIVRPVLLNDEPTTSPAHVGMDDRVPTMSVSRRQVAEVTADELESGERAGRVLSVSAPAMRSRSTSATRSSRRPHGDQRA
ncbi:NAD(P)-binding oxidoreductase [Nocardioides sp.]|uniref:NAD(P)-dependent oxidoreductase n=1 Tax=Nocardioides sp. TaxID=35761 RepID=UPI002ED0497E